MIPSASRGGPVRAVEKTCSPPRLVASLVSVDRGATLPFAARVCIVQGTSPSETCIGKTLGVGSPRIIRLKWRGGGLNADEPVNEYASLVQCGSRGSVPREREQPPRDSREDVEGIIAFSAAFCPGSL
ncbi:hypothetical protein XA68_14825 [Ophiocordyceps unilateralis]|uniref:Uncharacterized protein n=1 Tax=Ophiocordyceps unilateralis TaxID=268505 RepID=A0A2A9PMW4_OPHUN|nr:hypothetical protein XA68_14825 [Ophiocordyceps unilateralis]